MDEDQWHVDGLSQCLVPASWSQGPFRQAMRSNAAVGRLAGQVVAHRTACLEFSPGGGMWAWVSFANEEAESRWSGPVRGALRVLADSGIGPDTRVRDLSDAEVARLRQLIERSVKVEGSLRTEVAMNIKRLMDIGCYRGVRHRKGLPVRGQRTRTNARTKKGPRRTIAGKKKAVAKK